MVGVQNVARDRETGGLKNLKSEGPNAQENITNISVKERVPEAEASYDPKNAEKFIGYLPPDDFDGHLRINTGEFQRKHPLNPEMRIDLMRNNIVFHELYELYLRTDSGLYYEEAHEKSIEQGSEFSEEVNGKPDRDPGKADYLKVH